MTFRRSQESNTHTQKVSNKTYPYKTHISSYIPILYSQDNLNSYPKSTNVKSLLFVSFHSPLERGDKKEGESIVARSKSGSDALAEAEAEAGAGAARAYRRD